MTLAAAAAFVILALIVWLLIALIGGSDRQRGVTLSDVFAQPGRYFGQPVTVAGIASATHAGRVVFRQAGSRRTIRVIAALGKRLPHVSRKSRIEVTGVLHPPAHNAPRTVLGVILAEKVRLYDRATGAWAS